ncbi:probable tRNA pseudouridine synthase 1 isoform X3 [Acanthaster planci]|uniref:tRNA pseudouridine(55) synthase n=1 Tax=Acanthaster planci TaxID=133434 RepID=A0A8B7YYZ7_ACAPL|nr:probable tRNA pseudouridine synthase 1 isoform X3 [Acanthaster planci]
MMKLLVSDLNGLFAVVKPKGITSAGVVNQLKQVLVREQRQQLLEFNSSSRARNTNDRPPRRFRIGHGGTLDFNASGVLVIGIGRGTKQLASLLKGNKRYLAVGCLGSSTDTQDALGKVVQQSPADHVTKEMIASSLQPFVGDTMQVPPVSQDWRRSNVRLGPPWQNCHDQTSQTRDRPQSQMCGIFPSVFHSGCPLWRGVLCQTANRRPWPRFKNQRTPGRAHSHSARTVHPRKPRTGGGQVDV